MSRYLRCVVMSHRVSRGGIESNCFRVHLQWCYAVLSFFIKLVMDFPSFFRSFDIERSDGRSSLTLRISVAGQWLPPLRVNPYPTCDCLRLNNRLKWRTRNIHFIKNISSTHTLEIRQKLYMCASFSVSFLACKPCRRQFLILHPFCYVIT